MLVINKRLPIALATKISDVYSTIYSTLDQPLDHLRVNLYFISGRKMQKLNKAQRGIDKRTDVLSFPFTDTKATTKVDIAANDMYIDRENGRLLLGEVFVCKSVAKKSARNYGHSVHREICFLIVHGILHLLGYDHMETYDAKIMEELQENILSSCNITREGK